MSSSAAHGHRIRLPRPWRESITDGPTGPIVTFSRRFQKPTGLINTARLSLELACPDGWPLAIQLNGVCLTPALPTDAGELVTVPVTVAALQASNELVISFSSGPADQQVVAKDVTAGPEVAPSQPLFGQRFLKASALVIF